MSHQELNQQKPKLAMYWASSCGGCEIALVNLHEHLLEVTAAFDFFFCPCLLDTKRKDIEALADGAIAVTLFNGAIRTDENVEWAHLLRKKSQTLIAFGACAWGGGIPALSNFHTLASHLETIFERWPSQSSEGPVLPATKTQMPEGELTLPAFHERVRRLSEVVQVDYSIPGCPPEPEQIARALAALTGSNPPARGSVIGAGSASVCEECSRSRTDKVISRFRRTWEFEPDPDQCLLEQGLVCMGVATRDGCGALCPAVNAPCIGCYGPPEGVYDQAAKLVSTLGAIIDIAPIRHLQDEAEINRRVDETIGALPDLTGITSKFHAAGRRSSGSK